MSRRWSADPFVEADLLDSLPADVRADLLAHCRHQRFRKGIVVFHQDDPAGMLYVILSGRVRVSVTSPFGEELTLALLGPGECFGEMALLSGGERTATVVALEATDTLVLTALEVSQLLAAQPRLALALLQVLSRRLEATNAELLASCFLGAPARVARKLFELAVSDGVSTEEGLRIELRLSHRELADMVGTSRESIGRALHDFRARGVLKVENGRFVLVQPEWFGQFR
jgi:CRP/FNR family transcriptional regulator